MDDAVAAAAAAVALTAAVLRSCIPVSYIRERLVPFDIVFLPAGIYVFTCKQSSAVLCTRTSLSFSLYEMPIIVVYSLPSSPHGSRTHNGILFLM